MIRHLAVLLFVTGAIQQAPPVDPGKHEDVYAIYSTLMSRPPTVGRDVNDVYAIASATQSSTRAQGRPTTGGLLNRLPPPSSCALIPPGYENRWPEVLADFNAGADVSVSLQRELKISKAYRLLSTDETVTFRSEREESKVQGSRDLFFLSNVYFDTKRTLAVVGIASWCGLRCGLAQWKVYEKNKDGGWTEVVQRGECLGIA